MYRIAWIVGMALMESPYVFGYYASDVAGLWSSFLAGFALVLLSVRALSRERSERENQLALVVVRADDYRRTIRRSHTV